MIARTYTNSDFTIKEFKKWLKLVGCGNDSKLHFTIKEFKKWLKLQLKVFEAFEHFTIKEFKKWLKQWHKH